MQPKMTAEDRKWQARMDAETLMRAESVKADSNRLKFATTEARRVADEAMKAAAQQSQQASALQKKPVAKPPAGKKK